MVNAVYCATIDQKKFPIFTENNQHYKYKISYQRIPAEKKYCCLCVNTMKKKKRRIDKPIVKVEMLHYSKQHTSVRIARLMMESKKRDKTRYTLIALDQKIFL